MWEHYLFETRTGDLIAPLDVSSNRWQVRQNGYGSGTTVIPTRALDVAVPPGGWSAATRPWAVSVLSCWGEVPVYAGPIVSRRVDMATGALTLEHSELWRLLARRYLWGVGDWAANKTLVLDGRTKRGLVRSLVTRVALDNETASPRWPLPVVVPAPEPGPHHRTYYSYHFGKGMDLVEDVLGEVDGPDLAFRPEWASSGSVRWNAEIGTPLLTGPRLETVWGVEESPVAGLVYTEDGSDQLTGAFALGEGTEQDKIVGLGPTSVTLDLPVMDLAEDFPTATTQAEADAQAQGFVAEAQVLKPSWSFSVERAALDAGVRPGSVVSLYVEGNPLAADGRFDLRVVGMSGDLSERVQVEVVQGD